MKKAAQILTGVGLGISIGNLVTSIFVLFSTLLMGVESFQSAEATYAELGIYFSFGSLYMFCLVSSIIVIPISIFDVVVSSITFKRLRRDGEVSIALGVLEIIVFTVAGVFCLCARSTSENQQQSY